MRENVYVRFICIYIYIYIPISQLLQLFKLQIHAILSWLLSTYNFFYCALFCSLFTRTPRIQYFSLSSPSPSPFLLQFIELLFHSARSKIFIQFPHSFGQGFVIKLGRTLIIKVESPSITICSRLLPFLDYPRNSPSLSLFLSIPFGANLKLLKPSIWNFIVSTKKVSRRENFSIPLFLVGRAIFRYTTERKGEFAMRATWRDRVHFPL